MACGGLSKKSQKRLNAFSTTVAYEWFTDWLPAIGMDSAMVVLKGRAASSVQFQAQVVMQTAAVRTDQPSDPITKGSAQFPATNTNYFSYNTNIMDITSNTGSVMFVRFGVAYNLVSGASVPASADVELEVAYTQCGDIVAAVTHQLATTTSTAQYIAVTGWLPRILVDKVKAGLVCNSLTGNFVFQLAYRTAETSKESPSAWTLVADATGPAPYGAGEGCTSELPVSLGNNMWVQFGIMYKSTSGDGQASVSVALCARRS